MVSEYICPGLSAKEMTGSAVPLLFIRFLRVVVGRFATWAWPRSWIDFGLRDKMCAPLVPIRKGLILHN